MMKVLILPIESLKEGRVKTLMGVFKGVPGFVKA